jgi:hypothetical protein
MTTHANFGLVNAIVDLLKLGNKTKRELRSLLTNKFSDTQIDKAIEMSLKIKVIKLASIIKAQYHDKTIYQAV